MKKIFILTLMINLLFGCQNDWVSTIEKKIKKPGNKFKLVKKNNSIEKGILIKKYFYQSQTLSKLNVSLKHEEIFTSSTNYYKNDTITLAVFETVLSPILYKKKREIKEPICVLIEKKTFFKNKKEGIEKKRLLEVYKIDDIEKLESKLLKKDFEINKIGEKEYLYFKKTYDKILNF